MNDNLNEDDIDIDLIERYHRGHLDGPELEVFLKREKSDKDFAQKIRSYINIIEGIEYYGKQKNFAETIQGWENEIKEQPSSGTTTQSEQRIIPFHRKNLFWVAAAAVSLIIVSAIFLLRSGTQDHKALFSAYYQPYPNVFDPSVRGDIDTVSVNRKAFQAYDQGNYAMAAEYFREASSTDNKTERDIALLYLANCYLAQDSATAAKDILTRIDDESHVSDQAKWYLALAYLNLNELNQATTILNELADHPDSYQNKAILLLQEIHK